MKALVSIIALAVALAWPSVGEAQSKKSTAHGKATTKHYAQRPAKAVQRGAGQYQNGGSPCVRRVWWGCPGWDPDPNVRDMLARDVGDDN